jgi:hypothetical protein
MAAMRTSAADPAPFSVAPGVAAALQEFILPEKLGFGAVPAPVMFAADWSDGQWHRGRLVPYGPIGILPGSRALQYAELVFEGLKAYRPARRRASGNYPARRRSARIRAAGVRRTCSALGRTGCA